MVEREDGKHEALDLSRLADRHIRPGWVRTIHSAQGATADRVMAHLESFRANTADAPAVYVAISRAKDAVELYTDSRTRLTKALGLRDGAQVGAIDEVRQEVEASFVYSYDSALLTAPDLNLFLRPRRNFRRKHRVAHQFTQR